MNSQFKIADSLHFFDWFIFFFVLGVTFLSILIGQRLKQKLPEQDQTSSLELLLMGRRLTLPLFVATLVATWYGGIFGVTALTFEKGIYNLVTQGLFWYGTYLFFAFFMVKKIRQYDVLTLPEMVGQIFGSKSQKLSSILNFLNLLPLAYTISLGLFLQSLFGGDLFLNTSLGLLIVFLWSIWGGFRAVVFSDLVQFFFMIIAVVLVIFFSWNRFGNPLNMISLLPSTHLDWTGGEKISTLFVWGFIALSTLIDPNFYQRVLAAKNVKTAQRGIFISTFVWFVFDLCTTLGALYAKAYLPNARAENAYLMFSMQIMPSGFKGILLGGILAIILSSLDTYLFNAATCLSYDMLNNKKTFRLFHHHLALLSVSLLTLFLGTFFEGNVVEVWKFMGSFSAACLLFPILFGQWKPGIISDHHFFGTVMVGCLGIILIKFLKSQQQLPQEILFLDDFYIGLILTSTCLFVPLLWSFTLKFFRR